MRRLPSCEDCEAFAANSLHRTCSPNCALCGGRALWLIQRMRLAADVKRERLRSTLETWKSYGHDEAQLRQLAERKWGG